MRAWFARRDWLGLGLAAGAILAVWLLAWARAAYGADGVTVGTDGIKVPTPNLQLDPFTTGGLVFMAWKIKAAADDTLALLRAIRDELGILSGRHNPPAEWPATVRRGLGRAPDRPANG